MSEANKLLLRRWFEQVWNQKSEAAIDEMFSKHGKSHGFPEPDSVLVGPEGSRPSTAPSLAPFLIFTLTWKILWPRVIVWRFAGGFP